MTELWVSVVSYRTPGLLRQCLQALDAERSRLDFGVTVVDNASGDGSVEMVQAQGIDVHSPTVLHVVNTCLPASHGALTPAKVRASLQHASG